MKIYAGNAGSRLSALFNESLTKQPSAAARDASCIFTPLKCSVELKSVARQCFSQQSLRLIAMQCVQCAMCNVQCTFCNAVPYFGQCVCAILVRGFYRQVGYSCTWLCTIM